MWGFVYIQNFTTGASWLSVCSGFCVLLYNYKSVKFGYQNEFPLACSTENTLSWSNVQEPFICESWKMEWLSVISCHTHLFSFRIITLLANILWAEAPQKWSAPIFRKVFDSYLLNLAVWGYIKANSTNFCPSFAPFSPHAHWENEGFSLLCCVAGEHQHPFSPSHYKCAFPANSRWQFATKIYEFRSRPLWGENMRLSLLCPSVFLLDLPSAGFFL